MREIALPDFVHKALILFVADGAPKIIDVIAVKADVVIIAPASLRVIAGHPALTVVDGILDARGRLTVRGEKIQKLHGKVAISAAIFEKRQRCHGAVTPADHGLPFRVFIGIGPTAFQVCKGV